MAGQVLAIKEVSYPILEAVQKAAEQNVARDFRMGMPSVKSGVFSEQSDQVQLDYKYYAAMVILKTGKNYVPEYPDTEHICATTLKLNAVENLALLRVVQRSNHERIFQSISQFCKENNI